MEIKVALFGIHKLLSDTLAVLEARKLFPQVVIFPLGDSVFHKKAEEICKRNEISFVQTHSVKTKDFLGQFKTFSVNRIVVTGYNEIFPETLINEVQLGAINCHGGLLPEERGPIPWKWAIYECKSKTGVTYHKMTSKVDQGEILIRNEIGIAENDTSESLFRKISADISITAPRFFMELEINEYVPDLNHKEKFPYRGQVPAELTVFDLTQTASELHRRVKAFSPRPGVFFEKEGNKILITKTEPVLTLQNTHTLILNASDEPVAITEYEICG